MDMLTRLQLAVVVMFTTLVLTPAIGLTSKDRTLHLPTASPFGTSQSAKRVLSTTLQQASLTASVTATTTSTPLPTSTPLQLDQSEGVVVGQVVIQFSPTTTNAEREAYVQSLGGTVVEEIAELNSVVVRVPEAVAQQPLPSDPAVVSSEPDYYVVAFDDPLPPNDPLYDQQWALERINAPRGWEVINPSSPQVVIAVIDSGICANHPDLVGRILPGYDFVDGDTDPEDDFNHGCSVAGVIAANRDNGIGVVGIASNAQILPLRVLNDAGLGVASQVASAVIYAADHDADIINMSLGSLHRSAVLESAVQYAVGKGILVIASAGDGASSTPQYPANFPNVIAVGSYDNEGNQSSFSNYGEWVDIYAPGRNIHTTAIGDAYASRTGTSFAAPMVAAVAAMELAQGDNLFFSNGSGLFFYPQIGLSSEVSTPIPTSVLTTPIDPHPTNNTDENALRAGNLMALYTKSLEDPSFTSPFIVVGNSGEKFVYITVQGTNFTEAELNGLVFHTGGYLISYHPGIAEIFIPLARLLELVAIPEIGSLRVNLPPGSYDPQYFASSDMPPPSSNTCTVGPETCTSEGVSTIGIPVAATNGSDISVGILVQELIISIR